MAAPTLTFIYNTSVTDQDFVTASGNYRIMTPGSDLIVFTGDGVGDLEEGMGNATLASGVRSPTIRPPDSSIIPYVYVESGDTMYRVPLASYMEYNTGANRYVFGVRVSGTMNSDLYLEAWDDYTFSTTNSPVLSGSLNSGNESYVNAITTTSGSPPVNWDGDSLGGAYLRGRFSRVGLKRSSPIVDEDLYFNIYIQLEADSPTFHTTPVLAFRYLYT